MKIPESFFFFLLLLLLLLVAKKQIKSCWSFRREIEKKQKIYTVIIYKSTVPCPNESPKRKSYHPFLLLRKLLFFFFLFSQTTKAPHNNYIVLDGTNSL